MTTQRRAWPTAWFTVSAALTVVALIMLLQTALENHLRAAPRDPVQRPRAQLSGFYDLRALAEADGGTPGVALIDEERCSIGQATQPGLFAGNLLLNCDTLGIRNETTVAVNPLDPSNVVAGSHRYRLLLKGSTFLLHVVSAAYTTFDGGTTWSQRHSTDWLLPVLR